MTKGEGPGRKPGPQPVSTFKIKVVLAIVGMIFALVSSCLPREHTDIFRVHDGASCEQDCVFNPDADLDTSQVRVR